MVVTLGASESAPKPHGCNGVDAIQYGLPEGFFLIYAAFLVEHRISQETCRDLLIVACAWNHVSGDLVDCKLIKGHVPVQRIDHPVSIFPDRTAPIFFVAVGIGVTSEVEPWNGPSLAKVRRGQQRI